MPVPVKENPRDGVAKKATKRCGGDRPGRDDILPLTRTGEKEDC